MQRIGRASHQAEAVSRGVIFPKYRGDLLATAAITRAMNDGRGRGDARPPEPARRARPAARGHLRGRGRRRSTTLFALVRRAAPFAALPRAQFEGVLDMLSGRYPSDEFAELRPRLTWDRLRGTVRAPRGRCSWLVVTNAGTIPDRGLYGVFLADGTAGDRGARGPRRRVGELDEEMVFESREGEVFVLGASSWRIAEITRDRVLVEPGPGRARARCRSGRPTAGARPVELGRAIGALTRELAGAAAATRRAKRLVDRARPRRPGGRRTCSPTSTSRRRPRAPCPTTAPLVLERTRDEMGDWRLCLLSPWGGRVHAPWALALEAQAARRGRGRGRDGLERRRHRGAAARPRAAARGGATSCPTADEIEDLVVGELGGTALFAAHFREAAARALLLPRRRPGQRSPLWMQRKRAADLLAVAARYGSFPIILEAYRECLQDVFDLPALVDLARAGASGARSAS